MPYRCLRLKFRLGLAPTAVTARQAASVWNARPSRESQVIAASAPAASGSPENNVGHSAPTGHV